MNESNSIEAQNLNAIPMNDQTKFRLNEINRIKDYFNSEIHERRAISKKLSKHIAVFDYADKTFIVLSASFGTSCNSRWNSCWQTMTVVFSLTTGIVKRLLNVTRKKMKKHNKIVMLAKSKLNIIKTLMPQALIDLDINHEEFKTIVNEKEKYEQIKESIRNTKCKYELSGNSRDIRENDENP